MKEIICELRKEITIMKTMEIKPNFSALAKEYDLDYRTVKRYYEGYCKCQYKNAQKGENNYVQKREYP